MATIIRDIALDSSGDLKLVDGDLVLLTGVASLSQAVKNALQLVQGEWFLDTDAGVDYFGQFFIKNPSTSIIRNELNSAILGVKGVVSVDSLELQYIGASRTLIVTYAATTDVGLLTDTVSLGS